VLESRELRERLLLIPPGQKITYSHVNLAAGLRVGFPDHYQSFRVRIWKRFDQYRANNAENRRVRADAERECDHCHQGETGITHQPSRAVAQVLPQILDPSHAASVAASLLRLLNSAESLASFASRLFRVHSQADVLLGLSFDVIAQLFVQFALHF